MIKKERIRERITENKSDRLRDWEREKKGIKRKENIKETQREVID